MYKLSITHNGKFVLAKYFDSKKKAIAFRDEYNRNFNCDDYVAKLQSKKVSLIFHHSSTEKGYITKNSGRDDYYEGKFGIGIKRHIPNCKTDCTNQYHIIEYYVEEA